MTVFGYFLSCEEYGPEELVRHAVLAEEAGFEALWISDHFHPWLDEQGQSPFVWSVVGALSQVCALPVTTAVTCPLVRMHPVVVAQAAATSAVLHKGRFRLGPGKHSTSMSPVSGGLRRQSGSPCWPRPSLRRRRRSTCRLSGPRRRGWRGRSRTG